MRKFSAFALLVVALPMVGCGASGKGPAKPEETPVVTPAQVQESYTKGMPAEHMKRYQNKGMPGSK